MGLARELSMGPRKPRSRPGMTGDYILLRKLTRDPDPDLTQFREALDRVAASPHRLRYAEGAVYSAACTRYSTLTGTSYGPRQIEY